VVGYLAAIVCIASALHGPLPAPRPAPVYDRRPDHVGYVVRYDPGMMEDRARAHHAPPAPCYAAYTLARDADMARLWLHIVGPAGAIDCLVVDLPNDSLGHRQPLIRRGVWAELGYPWRWICGKGWTGRARDCPVRIWVRRMS